MRLFIQSLSESAEAPIKYNYDYILIPLYGQSLSINIGEAPYLTPTSDKGFKYSTGIQVTPTEGATLVPLIKENDTCTAMTEMMDSLGFLKTDAKVISCTPGTGGASIASLSKPGTYYTRLLSFVQYTKDLADSEGKSFICPVVPFIQGEADQVLTNPSNYDVQLKQLADDLDADIKAITGQTEDVLMFIAQLGTHGELGRYPRVAIEDNQAIDANTKLIMNKAMYQNDFYTDQIHGTTQLYALHGAKIGYLFYDKFVKLKSGQGLRVSNHVYSNLKSTITFDVPYTPLNFSTEDVDGFADGNYGFKTFDVVESLTDVNANSISEAAASVISVVITTPDTIEVTYSQDPTGSRLTYGVNAQVWDSVNGVRGLATVGRRTGARGNLRDSQGEVVSMVITDSSGVEQYNRIYNYCPIFEIQL